MGSAMSNLFKEASGPRHDSRDFWVFARRGNILFSELSPGFLSVDFREK
jgi:hypothetical protein